MKRSRTIDDDRWTPASRCRLPSAARDTQPDRYRMQTPRLNDLHQLRRSDARSSAWEVPSWALANAGANTTNGTGRDRPEHLNHIHAQNGTGRTTTQPAGTRDQF